MSCARPWRRSPPWPSCCWPARSTPRKRAMPRRSISPSRSLLGVLNDVLDFSRLDAGRLELQQTTFDLHDLIQGVGAVLQTRANEKGLTGGVDIGANCPRFIVGDAARLRQVLMSLVDNALKFTVDRLGAPPCERERSRRPSCAPIRRDRYRRRPEQGGAGAAVPPFVQIEGTGRRARRRHRARAFDRAQARAADGRRGRLRKRGRARHPLLVHAAGRPRAA